MLGLSVEELYDLTPRQLQNKLKGFRRLDEMEWDRTRTLMAAMYNTAGKTMKRYVSPQKLLPLPGDKELKVIHSSLEDPEKYKAVKDLFRQSDLKRQNKAEDG